MAEADLTKIIAQLNSNVSKAMQEWVNSKSRNGVGDPEHLEVVLNLLEAIRKIVGL